MAASKSKNEVDTQAVVKLFVESVRQKRKKQTPGVKRTRSGIVSKLCKEVGITREMALFMLKDMNRYSIRDIEPKYRDYTNSARKGQKKKPKKPESRRKPKPSVAPANDLSMGFLDEVSEFPGE